MGEEVRGSSQVTYIPAIDAYMLFLTVYAQQEGELLTFKYYDASEGLIHDIEESAGFVINSILGEVDDPEPFHLSTITSTGDLADESMDLNIYPNPFANSVFIRFYATEGRADQLIVSDALSRVVARIDVEVKQGINVVEWRPGRDIQVGPYFIKLRDHTSAKMQKILYVD